MDPIHFICVGDSFGNQDVTIFVVCMSSLRILLISRLTPGPMQHVLKQIILCELIAGQYVDNAPVAARYMCLNSQYRFIRGRTLGDGDPGAGCAQLCGLCAALGRVPLALVRHRRRLLRPPARPDQRLRPSLPPPPVPKMRLRDVWGARHQQRREDDIRAKSGRRRRVRERLSSFREIRWCY